MITVLIGGTLLAFLFGAVCVLGDRIPDRSRCQVCHTPVACSDARKLGALGPVVVLCVECASVALTLVCARDEADR